MESNLRAIVISANPERSLVRGAVWGDLSPLVDRPFLHHVVECAVGHGVRRIDFVLSEESEPVRAVLGDGTRWGAKFRYYPAGNKSAYDTLRRIPLGSSEEAVLIAHSDRLPLIQLNAAPSLPTLFCWKGAKLSWTGWALTRAADLPRVPEGIDERELFAFLLDECNGTICEDGPRPLTAGSYEDLLDANRRVLMREFPGLLVGGKEVQPGVWVARNVTIHPTARLAAPAFLGENSRVGAMVQVGPAASIGKDCLIERETFVSDSVVCGGSYVGRQLALRGVVVDRSRLISTRWDAEIEGVDDLLLGSVFGTPWRTRARRACGRAIAAVALVLASPCLLALWVGSALRAFPTLRRQSMVRTPTVSEPYRWKTFPLWSFGARQIPFGDTGWARHFFFCFLPALPSIAAGHLGLVGARPRTKEDVEQSPASKRTAYLRSRVGVLQFDSLRNAAPDSDSFSSDGADTGWHEAITRMTLYIGLVLRDLLGSLPLRRRRQPE